MGGVTLVFCIALMFVMIQWDVDLVNIAVFSLPITTVTKSLGLGGGGGGSQ